MHLLWIAIEIPAIVEFSGLAEVIDIVVKKNWAASLRGEDSVHPPTRKQLSEARPRRQFISRRECEAMPDIRISIAEFCRRIVTVLNIEGPVAARRIDRVRVRVARNEIEP